MSARSAPSSSSRPPRTSFTSAIPGSTALSGNALEQLTNDHRVIVSSEQSYLGRALGVNPADRNRLSVAAGRTRRCVRAGHRRRLRTCLGPLHRQPRSGRARPISTRPLHDHRRGRRYEQGSPDNLTVQIVRIDRFARQRRPRGLRPAEPNCRCRRCWSAGRSSTVTGSSGNCMPPAAATSISRVDIDSDDLVALKIPSIDLRGDPAYLKRFMMEEWVARRINIAACAETLPAVAQAQLTSTS